MTELETKIYDSIKQSGQYNYSSDLGVKSFEIKAVKNLAEKGHILIRGQALGYVVAKVL